MPPSFFVEQGTWQVFAFNAKKVLYQRRKWRHGKEVKMETCLVRHFSDLFFGNIIP